MTWINSGENLNYAQVGETQFNYGLLSRDDNVATFKFLANFTSSWHSTPSPLPL
jgi:hypothetical protein